MQSNTFVRRGKKEEKREEKKREEKRRKEKVGFVWKVTKSRQVVFPDPCLYCWDSLSLRGFYRFIGLICMYCWESLSLRGFYRFIGLICMRRWLRRNIDIVGRRQGDWTVLIIWWFRLSEYALRSILCNLATEISEGLFTEKILNQWSTQTDLGLLSGFYLHFWCNCKHKFIV